MMAKYEELALKRSTMLHPFKRVYHIGQAFAMTAEMGPGLLVPK